MALEIDDHADELRQEICDYKNAWGRVTKLLNVPWDASAGKVCEEIAALQKTVAKCKQLASTVPQGDTRWESLFERLAEIEKECR